MLSYLLHCERSWRSTGTAAKTPPLFGTGLKEAFSYHVFGILSFEFRVLSCANKQPPTSLSEQLPMLLSHKIITI